MTPESPPSRLLRLLAKRKHSQQKDWSRSSSPALGSGPTPAGEEAQGGAESRPRNRQGWRSRPTYRSAAIGKAPGGGVGANEMPGENALLERVR